MAVYKEEYFRSRSSIPCVEDGKHGFLYYVKVWDSVDLHTVPRHNTKNSKVPASHSSDYLLFTKMLCHKAIV